MADSSDFFLFSLGNTLEENSEQKGKEESNESNPVGAKASNEDNPLFRESHTPTEIDTDDSRAVTPRAPEQKENVPEKANTKEVVFLEEEKDLPSPSSHSDSEEEAVPLPPLSPQDTLTVEGENNENAPSAAANQTTLQFINTFTPLNDDNEFYDLEDAARYFSRQNETRTCHLCGNPGHLSRNCPLANTTNVCFFCAQPTHNSRSCPLVVCRRCHKPGHESNACSEKSIPPFCHYCSSRLHQPDDCPIIPHPYDKAVFQLMHCVCCGKQGHLVCKPQPALSKGYGGRCAVCGSPNHSYVQCPSRNSHRTAHTAAQENGGACFICGKMGHFASKCPLKKRGDSGIVMPGRNGQQKRSGRDGGYAKRIRE